MSVRRQTLAAALGASISAGWAEPTYREPAGDRSAFAEPSPITERSALSSAGGLADT